MEENPLIRGILKLLFRHLLPCKFELTLHVPQHISIPLIITITEALMLLMAMTCHRLHHSLIIADFLLRWPDDLLSEPSHKSRAVAVLLNAGCFFLRDVVRFDAFEIAGELVLVAQGGHALRL